MPFAHRYDWIRALSVLCLCATAGMARADEPAGCRVSGQLTGLAEHLLKINANGARVGVMREVFEDNSITTKDQQSVDCELDGTFAFPEPVAPGHWLIRVDATYLVNPREARQTRSMLLNKVRIEIGEDEAQHELELPPAWATPGTTAEQVHRILDSEMPVTNFFVSWSYHDVQVANLGKLEDREGVVSELDRILQDAESPPLWAYIACDALVRMQPVTPSALKAVERALSGPYKRWAIGSVGRTGWGEALPLLDAISALKDDEDSAVRDYAIRAIGGIAAASDQDVEGTVEALIDGLRDDDARVRKDAADFLGRLGPRAASAVPELEERLADPDGPTRVWSAHALYRIDGRVDAPLEVLIEILEGNDVEATWHAALAVASFGPDAAPAVPALEKLQEYDGEPPFINNERGLKQYQNRRNALRALEQIDPETAAKYGGR